MLTLHGFSSSNYYNVVKYVLLYKGVTFSESLIYSGGDEWLDISPVGKIPAITTESGQRLSETAVICDYLEEFYPEKPLYPQDPGERAAVRQIMKVSELYLELPSRRLIANAFTGKTAPESVKDEIRQVINRGIVAMRRLCQFSPWIAGERFTLADVYVFYVCSVVGTIGSKQLDWDILGEIPGLKDWINAMRDSDTARSVEADRRANEPEFTAYLKTRLGAA